MPADTGLSIMLSNYLYSGLREKNNFCSFPYRLGKCCYSLLGTSIREENINGWTPISSPVTVSFPPKIRFPFVHSGDCCAQGDWGTSALKQAPEQPAKTEFHPAYSTALARSL